MGVVISVPSGHVGIIEKNGRFSHVVPAGAHFVIPCLFNLAGTVLMGERKMTMEAEGTTREYAFVKCSVSIWYKVMEDPAGVPAGSNSNAYKAFYKAENNPEPKMKEIINAILKSQIRSFNLAKVFSKGDDIARQLQEEATSEMHQYGFMVVNITIGDIRSEGSTLPPKQAAKQAAATPATAAPASTASAGSASPNTGAASPESGKAAGAADTKAVAADSTKDASSPTAGGTANALPADLTLDPVVMAGMEKLWAGRKKKLVSCLQIIKTDRKFGREPAPRILCITVPQKQGFLQGLSDNKCEFFHSQVPMDGPVTTVEMHSVKRTPKDQQRIKLPGKLAGLGRKDSTVKELKDEDGEDGGDSDGEVGADDASYRVIRTYPLLQMKDVKFVENVGFVLSFEGKTPDLHISNQNARQVSAFIDDAINTCRQCCGELPPSHAPPSQQQPTSPAEKPAAGEPPKPQAGGGGGGAMSQTKNIMDQNRQMLMQNKEKLENMADRSADLANQAANFLDAVRKMREQQQNRKWYQL